MLFHVLAERYQRRSVMLTSNLVFSQRDQIFPYAMTVAAAIKPPADGRRQAPQAEPARSGRAPRPSGGRGEPARDGGRYQARSVRPPATPQARYPMATQSVAGGLCPRHPTGASPRVFSGITRAGEKLGHRPCAAGRPLPLVAHGQRGSGPAGEAGPRWRFSITVAPVSLAGCSPAEPVSVSKGPTSLADRATPQLAGNAPPAASDGRCSANPGRDGDRGATPSQDGDAISRGAASRPPATTLRNESFNCCQ